MDFLTTQGYSKLGLPGNMLPNNAVTNFINTEFGLAFHSDSAFLRGMLDRGFTTVRDVAGADFGLAAAVEEGLLPGPRLVFGGKALSQTGGHGDLRRAILDETISKGAPTISASPTSRSRVCCPSVKRRAAAVLSAANSTASRAEPTCSIERAPRRDDHTICTAVAPDAVFTVRT